MHLHNITITTGHSRRSARSDVADEAIRVVDPWLRSALQSAEPVPLMPPLAEYAALATAADGALVVTLYGRAPQVGARLPLVSFAVASRSSHGRDLWEALQKSTPDAVPHLPRPPAPWCATTVHPTAASDMGALEWSADFGQVVAWTWLTRNPSIHGA